VINARSAAWAGLGAGWRAWESFDAFTVPADVVAMVPANVALHYAVFPLREEAAR
jgi:hypothetical protein